MITGPRAARPAPDKTSKKMYTQGGFAMTSAIMNDIPKKRFSVGTQMIAGGCAMAAAVILPQIFHVLGAVSGINTALGEILLPMHLPVILVGLIIGPWAGCCAGLLSPLISYMLTDMPAMQMLPFMMIELFVYGLLAGMLRELKIHTFIKVVIIQIGGRMIRAAAILAATQLLNISSLSVSVIWTSIRTGLFGIVLQWLLIPLIIYRIEKGNNK